MKRAVLCVFVVMLWVYPCLADETIYTWTDKNGVKRFSDHPPENVKHYDTIIIPPDNSEHGAPAGDSRPEYDQMIENIRHEKKQAEQARKQAGNDLAAKEKQNEENRKKERIENERKKLQEQIDILKKRPVGRSYSQSLKNAQIGEIEKQLDKLKNSPDEYFKSK